MENQSADKQKYIEAYKIFDEIGAIYEKGFSAKLIDDYSTMQIIGNTDEPVPVPSSYSYFSIMCIDGAISGVTIKNAIYRHFKGDLYFEIGLIFIHLISFGAFGFLLCYKINEYDSMKFAHVFVPYYFSVGAQLFYSIGVNFINKGENLIRKNIIKSLSISLILCAGIIIQVFLDGETNDKFYISTILYLVAFLGLTLEPTIDVFKEISDDNSDEEIANLE